MVLLVKEMIISVFVLIKLISVAIMVIQTKQKWMNKVYKTPTTVFYCMQKTDVYTSVSKKRVNTSFIKFIDRMKHYRFICK